MGGTAACPSHTWPRDAAFQLASRRDDRMGWNVDKSKLFDKGRGLINHGLIKLALSLRSVALFCGCSQSVD